jgi:hypothetical protein
MSTWLAAGCRQEVESTDIRTSGIFPEVDVRADGNGSSRVQVRLKVGGAASNTFLELVGDDQLTATAENVTRPLDSSGGVSYATTFQTEAPGPFVISFLRGMDDVSAPATTVDLPTPFTVTLATRELSRATGDLTFTWTPAGGSGNIESILSGSCINLLVDTIPDDGTATITRDQIHASNPSATETCTVTLSLTRQQSGQVDPAFTEGGKVVARQVRAATFTSMP